MFTALQKICNDVFQFIYDSLLLFSSSPVYVHAELLLLIIELRKVNMESPGPTVNSAV